MVIVDPNHDNVLYAASEWAGIWKSTDRAQSWQQTSAGLRSGLTAELPNVLAIDPGNSQHLLYATQEVDGRIPFPCTSDPTHLCNFGGLYYSIDGAASWHHVELPGCPAVSDVAGVAFTAPGTAVVATNSPSCQLLTTSDPDLAPSTWRALPAPAFPPNGSIRIASVPPAPLPLTNQPGTFFACEQSIAYRSRNLDSTTPTWDVVDLSTAAGGSGNCWMVAGAPAEGGDPNTAVAMFQVNKPDGSSPFQVLHIDFDSGEVFPIGPPLNSGGCCGQSGVWVAPRPTNPGGANPGPGSTYDVFAADGFQFFHYSGPVDGTGSWSNAFSTHVDTWSLAFPASYDSASGLCTAYASDDGGISVNAGTAPDPCLFDSPDAWVTAGSGLHGTFSTALTGISQGPTPSLVSQVCTIARGGQPCPVLYLGSADNDTFMLSPFPPPGYAWAPLQDGLGDSAGVLVDPTIPSLGLAYRNGTYRLFVGANGNPPLPNQSFIDMIPPSSTFITGIATPGAQGLQVVQTVPGEVPFSRGDYIGARSVTLAGCPTPGGGSPSCTHDVVVRNVFGATDNTTAQSSWTDVSPNAQFGPQQVAAVYPSGGHSALTLYVLTSNDPNVNSPSSGNAGRVLKSHCPVGSTCPPYDAWLPVMGSGATSLTQAFDLFVNPYDPNELYATDLGTKSIKTSRNGGVSWNEVPVLKDIATHDGEFDFDCGNFAFGTHYFDKEIFGNQCPLAEMVFVRDHPEVRVAVLYPGGLGFSRDSGQHWISLDVTNADSSQQTIALPQTAFYDPTPNAVTKKTSLFVALEGRGVMRVDGPFATLTELVAVYQCPLCQARASQVAALLSGQAGAVQMRSNGRGQYSGSILFDAAAIKTLQVQITVDGQVKQQLSFTPTQSELAGGVITRPVVTCASSTDCASLICAQSTCQPPACSPSCNRGSPCGADTDCGSNVCSHGSCQPPACSPRCSQGLTCGDNSDCESFVCTNNRCAPSSCSPSCNQGAPCGASSDCAAHVCTNGLCQPPVCSPTCPRNSLCNNNGDCASHVCSANHLCQ
jgi:hypothetical protein